MLAGDRQPPAVHLLAHALNDRLGNVGQTVTLHGPHRCQTGRSHGIAAGTRAGHGARPGRIAGDPWRQPGLHRAGGSTSSPSTCKKSRSAIHHGLYVDETSYQCHWHLPEAHYLEAWSDARAYDGTASIVQPLIEPLYQGRSAHEVRGDAD